MEQAANRCSNQQAEAPPASQLDISSLHTDTQIALIVCAEWFYAHCSVHASHHMRHVAVSSQHNTTS